MYKIKQGYNHRTDLVYSTALNRTDECQYEVYQLAYTLAKVIDKKPVLDIGCGSGYKLRTIFSDFDTVGIDTEKTYNFLVANYPDDHWRLKTDVPPAEEFGVVIMADVIEHVLNPDELLDYIGAVNFDYLVLSTPSRDFKKISQNGPPHNEAHAREWTNRELNEYLSDYFTIINHFVINAPQCTQCVIAKKRNSHDN